MNELRTSETNLENGESDHAQEIKRHLFNNITRITSKHHEPVESKGQLPEVKLKGMDKKLISY